MKTIQVGRQLTFNGETIGGTQTITSGELTLLDESIPNGSATVALAFDKSKIAALGLVAPGALTLVFKDSGAATIITVVLVANVPYIWTAGDAYFANPFAANVANVVVTNSTGAAVQLSGMALVDPT